MSPVPPARRAAERFDAAVESSSTEGLDARTVELLDLVGALRSAPVPPARDAFVAELRSRLMVAAETELVAAPARRHTIAAPRTTTRRERRLGAVLAGFALVGATTSMAVASQSALPGDVLYPVKRIIENADTGLSGNGDKGDELVAHASTRLSELDALSREPMTPRREQAVESTLKVFTEQADDASDQLIANYDRTGSEMSVARLRDFTGTSLDRLGSLEQALPASARAGVLAAAQTLFAIDQTAAELCPECGGVGITDIPPSLLAADVSDLLSPGGDTVDSASQDPAPAPPRSPKPSAAPQPTPSAPPVLPSVDPDDLTSQTTAPAPPAPSASPTKGGLLGDLLGGKKKTPKPSPTAPADGVTPLLPVPSVVQDLLDGVGDLTGTLLDPLLKPSP